MVFNSEKLLPYDISIGAVELQEAVCHTMEVTVVQMLVCTLESDDWAAISMCKYQKGK